jgi:tryptophanyl-tRNA synthetase
MSTIFSGVQPSGNLTLGNYLGAIRNWVPLQESHACYFCIVDLHALTVPQDPEKLRSSTLEVAASYIACGIDPQKSVIFVQSGVSGHSELGWLLGCQTPLGWLNRMTQFKDKVGKNKESGVLGLYAYPVLMAADILLYHATHVPVGEDQKQHLELARDIAIMFNKTYASDFFPVPDPLILGHATRVMSLRDGTKKMSKSDPSDFSRIHLMDDADTIRQKIRKAKTDPDTLTADLEVLKNRPEAFNLMSIYAALVGDPLLEIAHEYEGKTFSSFKEALTEVLIEHLVPIGSKTRRLLDHPDELLKILESSRDKANAVSEKTLQKVHDLMGILTV